MLFIYREGKNTCTLKQRFFATLETACCMFSFLAFLIVKTEKKTLESIRQYLYKGCFPILYILTISVKQEKSSNFFVEVLYVFLLYLFEGNFSARLGRTWLMKNMVFKMCLHFISFFKMATLHRIEFVFLLLFFLIILLFFNKTYMTSHNSKHVQWIKTKIVKFHIIVFTEIEKQPTVTTKTIRQVFNFSFYDR